MPPPGLHAVAGGPATWLPAWHRRGTAGPRPAAAARPPDAPWCHAGRGAGRCPGDQASRFGGTGESHCPGGPRLRARRGGERPPRFRTHPDRRSLASHVPEKAEVRGGGVAGDDLGRLRRGLGHLSGRRPRNARGRPCRAGRAAGQCAARAQERTRPSRRGQEGGRRTPSRRATGATGAGREAAAPLPRRKSRHRRSSGWRN